MINFITLFLCIPFGSVPVLAQPVLTTDTAFQRGNTEIDLREANSVLMGTGLDKANEIFSFLEQRVYPVVPESLRAKLSKRTIRILFQKDLEKGALFIDTANPGEPLLLKVRSTLLNDPSFFRILSHEWFHALHFVIHPDEPSWLREGMAQVFERIVMGGYNGPNLIEALESSTTRLEHEFNIAQTNREAYGHVFLYVFYLFQKCGKENLFWKIAESQTGKFGEHTIDHALSQVGGMNPSCSNFKKSVIHAELARFHNRKTKENGGSSDDYLIVPELGRTMKTVLTENDVAAVIPAMQPYEPRIFRAQAFKALGKMMLGDEWTIYSLGQSTPYSVRFGLGINPKASPPDLIFVMKTR